MPAIRCESFDDEWFLGERVVLRFSPQYADGTPLSNPATMAWSYRVKRAASLPDSAAVVTKTSGAGIAVDGAQVVVTLNASDTRDLAAYGYHHELKRTNDGAETVWARGVLNLRRGVHHT